MLIPSLPRVLLCMTLLSVASAALSAGPEAPRRKPLMPVYFSEKWCPTDLELEVIQESMRVVRSGCCIIYAAAMGPEGIAEPALAPWKDKIIPDYPGACIGDPNVRSPDDDQRIAEMRATREAAKAEAERAQAERDASAARAKKAAIDEQLTRAPRVLREMSVDELCVTYGAALRDERLEGTILPPGMLQLARAETQHRKLRIDDSQASRKTLKIGASQCQMLASMGVPQRQNRSVGSWGTDVQNVFAGPVFIYTRNGVVRSFQD